MDTSIMTLKAMWNRVHQSALPSAVATLIGLAALGACLRLWGIDTLFNAIHDSDPGVHALAGRFIMEGYVPYRDFVQVHPPLYDFVLAAVYKVFGYEFLYGRYLSVCLSLVSLVLVYLLGRRLYSHRVGFFAALLFAVEPMMVYFGRRCVQEALGFLLVLIAAMLAVRYLERRRMPLLFWCGIFLGLAISAKYVFAPVAIAFFCALVVLSLDGDMWRSIGRIGSLRFWGAYAVVFAAVYALILFLRFVMHVPLPLPFIDPLYAIPRHIATCLLTFVVPLLVLWRWWIPGLRIGTWMRSLWKVIVQEKLWFLIVGGIVGFLAVTGYFWVTMPGEYLQQTVLWQTGRLDTEVPSIVGIARNAFIASSFARMSLLSIVLIVPLCLALLNRPSFSRSDCFLVVTIIVILISSQGFYHLARYYASALLLALIVLASFAPRVSDEASGAQRIGLLAVVSALALCVSLTLGLLNNYSGYDVASPIGTTERYLYDTTNSILEQEGAVKVFSTNPIYPALSATYESSLKFDSFAVVFLEGSSAEEIVDSMRQEGVDYVVVDIWARFWDGTFGERIQAMIQEVRRQGNLVALVQPDSAQWVEVYRLGPAPTTLVNGDFAFWGDYSGIRIPIGWNPVLIGGEGDAADIFPSGLDAEGGVRLIVYEDGLTEPGAMSTHAGLTRRMAFPRTDVTVKVMPGVNTESLGATPLGPAIHFLDGEGHSVILGFSDAIESEQVAVCGECGHVAVIQQAPLHRWSEHSINVAKYWLEAGWEIPEELTVLVVLSAHAETPGYYTSHVGYVSCDLPE